MAALVSVASTTTPSLERVRRGGGPPEAVAASSGSTGFGGLDHNTVTGKSEKGRTTFGNGPAVAALAALAWRTPLGGGPSNKASQNRRGPENARKRAQTRLPF